MYKAKTISSLHTSIKKSGPYLRLKKRILAKYAHKDRDGIEKAASIIRESPLFDAERYAEETSCRRMGFDPAFHYVLAGEQEGTLIDGFDGAFYKRQYPDVKGNSLLHYILVGRSEGRLPGLWSLPKIDTSLNTMSKPVVVVLIHEASRTGAPILGLNIIDLLKARFFVIAVVYAAGDLMQSFASSADLLVTPVPRRKSNDNALVKDLVESCKPLFVIANSIESSWLVPDFASFNIPAITLVHEFLSLYRHSAVPVAETLNRSKSVVFPAPVVMKAASECYPEIDQAKFIVLAQGQSKVPRLTEQETQSPTLSKNLRALCLSREFAKSKFLVAGLGSVDARKGVDLFVATAVSVCATYPDLSINFIWIGKPYVTALPDPFQGYLMEQIKRSELGGRFIMMDNIDDYESVFDNIDLLYMCSRIDPLPNVAIDAALASVPVLCFKDATGIADYLQDNAELKRLVVPHLDLGAAARTIGLLASDPIATSEVGSSIKNMAENRFDMVKYVDGLIDLATKTEAA